MKPKLVKRYDYTNKQGEVITRSTLTIDECQEGIHISISIIEKELTQKQIVDIIEHYLITGMHLGHITLRDPESH